jgi:hypothetical protein
MLMFRKRSIKCPLTVEDQNWIANNLDWINENVVNLSSQPTIEPTKQFFKWEFTGDKDDAKFLLVKIGEYANVDTKNIQLNFYDEDEEKKRVKKELGINIMKDNNKIVGYYSDDNNKYTIGIEIKQLQNSFYLIAIIIHELCHHILINLKSVPYKSEEDEWLTDLLAIAYGFGIFIGNSKFSITQWQGNLVAGWTASSQGYLPQQATGYAMAEIEMRKENKRNPKWLKYCTPNLKSDFKSSMKYLKLKSIIRE